MSYTLKTVSSEKKSTLSVLWIRNYIFSDQSSQDWAKKVEKTWLRPSYGLVMITDPFTAFILPMDLHHHQRQLLRKCATLAEIRSTVVKKYCHHLILIVFFIADVLNSQLYALNNSRLSSINLLQSNIFWSYIKCMRPFASCIS